MCQRCLTIFSFDQHGCPPGWDTALSLTPRWTMLVHPAGLTEMPLPQAVPP